ncbi:hypothetical protein [Actinopolymorpha pittospori]|uniref:Uncharacterized protein n=1 Tax=Actinopolymorpha pittospori TaxID=648752 RepID=A0A927N211_9ACTN|nr:hypothetical protein [Actinopolymorpha pittospori]MBE1611196.1 hypothetical protein [Actinopolymorpha pittospori]
MQRANITASPGTERVATRRPGATLWLLRATATLHGLMVVAQPILAGVYLSGQFDALEPHSVNATLISTVSMVQLAASVLYAWPGGGRVWPAVFSLALFLAEGMQIGMGYTGNLAVHIPLGVSVVTAQIVFVVWVLRGGARRPRRPRRRALRPTAEPTSARITQTR